MSSVLDLVTDDGEQRVASTEIAEAMGLQHASVIRLVRAHVDDFASFGRVRFQIAPFDTAGGKQSREVVYLNEDQCYLLLTYSRNSAQVRALKVAFVRAFGMARREGVAKSLTAWQELQRLEIENASSLTRASIGSRLMLERKRALPHLRDRRERLEAQVIVPLFPQQA